MSRLKDVFLAYLFSLALASPLFAQDPPRTFDHLGISEAEMASTMQIGELTDNVDREVALLKVKVANLERVIDILADKHNDLVKVVIKQNKELDNAQADIKDLQRVIGRDKP